jgi:hypothetical protein
VERFRLGSFEVSAGLEPQDEETAAEAQATAEHSRVRERRPGQRAGLSIDTDASGGSAKAAPMEGPSRSWWILTGAVTLVAIVASLTKGVYWPLVFLPLVAYCLARGLGVVRRWRWW